MIEVQDSYNRQFNLELRKLEEQRAMRMKRREMDRHLRRERLLRTKYERMLEEVMGEKPPSPLQALIVERLGNELPLLSE